MRSQTLNISRYTNGTLARIQPETTNFISTDYDPANNTGTWLPPYTRLTPSFSGGLKLGEWQYLDGEQWKTVVGGQHGFVFSGKTLVVYANSDLFKTADATLTIKLVASDPDYWDSVTLTRETSPLELYRKNTTKINQTNDKIALIASAEELAKYSTGSTMSSKLSTLEQTSEGFRQTVESNYATKVIAKGYADTAQSNAAADATAKANAAQAAAQEYTATQLTKYSTITQTDEKIATEVAKKTSASEVRSIIEQEADSIRLKADTITWESANSSMDESGHLIASSAEITGDFISRDSTKGEYIRMNESRLWGGSSSGAVDGVLDLSANAPDGGVYTVLDARDNGLELLSGGGMWIYDKAGNIAINAPQGEVRLKGNSVLVNGYPVPSDRTGANLIFRTASDGSLWCELNGEQHKIKFA